MLATSDAIPVFGQNVTLTAKVPATAIGTLAMPVGQVAFLEGGTTLGSASLVNGVAAAVLPVLQPGTHQIASVYSGDSNWTSTSSTVSVTVTKAATTVEISAAPGSAGQAGMSLTASLAVKQPDAGMPSGYILFIEAVTNTLLATVPLTGVTASTSLPPGAASNTVIATYSGDDRFANSSSASPAHFSVLNAASYQNTLLAPGEIVTLFSPGLTNETLAAALPLPDTLGGVSVVLTDSSSSAHRAPLFYISPGQLAFLVPPETAQGPSTLRVANPQGTLLSAAIRIGPVSPGLFTANADGKGAASAQIIRVHSDGTLDSPQNTAAYDPTTQAWTSFPISPGSNGDAVVLVIYATGIRNHSTPVTVSLNGQVLPVLYAGPQPIYVGLDQVNVLVPPGLQRGTLGVSITVDGNVSNSVTMAFR